MKRMAPTGLYRVLIPVSVLYALMAGAWIAGLRYNTTPSWPMGFYLLEALDGDPDPQSLVFACPPDTHRFREAYRRRYIGAGPCPGGYTPILKMVIAGAGTEVKVGTGVSVDGTVLRNSTVFAADGQGRYLTAWVGGRVPNNHYLLMSDHFAGSFDSRYFGPLHRKQIIGNARPLLTW